MSWGRGLRIVFVVAACLSFLANAAVIGLAVRAYRAGLLPAGGAMVLMSELPREERRRIVAAIRNRGDEIATLRDEVDIRRAALIAELTAPVRNPSRIRAAMAEVRRATANLQRRIQEIAFEAVIGGTDGNGAGGTGAGGNEAPRTD
ncbi:MAG: periplasmic heavy metal sensor [Paracoccaceae bacterium]